MLEIIRQLPEKEKATKLFSHLYYFAGYWSGFSGLEDKLENYSLVTHKLESANGKTVLTQTGFANEQARQHSQTAWTNVLQQIKQMTE